MSIDKAKQELFDEFLRWRANEGKDDDSPATGFYGWAAQNKQDAIARFTSGTGYQEIVSWVKVWERAKR